MLCDVVVQDWMRGVDCRSDLLKHHVPNRSLTWIYPGIPFLIPLKLETFPNPLSSEDPEVIINLWASCFLLNKFLLGLPKDFVGSFFSYANPTNLRTLGGRKYFALDPSWEPGRLPGDIGPSQMKRIFERSDRPASLGASLHHLGAFALLQWKNACFFWFRQPIQATRQASSSVAERKRNCGREQS